MTKPPAPPTEAELTALDNRIRELKAAQRRIPNGRVLELQAQLASGSRDMFMSLFADALDGQASLAEIRKMSAEDPLRGAQFLQIISKLVGVAERQEVVFQPEKMGDAELLAIMEKLGFSQPERLFPHELELQAEPERRREATDLSSGGAGGGVGGRGIPDSGASQNSAAPTGVDEPEDRRDV